MPKVHVKLQLLGCAATAALIASAFAVPAQAAPARAIYSGGATFPEKAYRDIMNCYGDSSGTELETGLTATFCNGLAGYNPNVQALYTGVGSGNGLSAWRAKNPDALNTARTPDAVPVPSSSAFGPYYGDGVGAGWLPDTNDTGPNYPDYSFSGSDDPLTTAQLATYNTNKVPGGWGEAKQLPALIGAVAIPYTAASGVGVTWTESGVAVSGNVSKLKLSTDSLCGIYTGAITNWNHAELTADNGGTSLTGGGSAPITVVYRTDGSGTTFLFANALINQCAGSAHPVPASWQTADPAGTNVNVSGQSNNNWFVNVQNDPVIDLPANFVGASGNGGVKAAVLGGQGRIGYSTTDFVNLKSNKPDPTGPKAANLQSYASFIAVPAIAPVWKAPTFGNAGKIMVPTPGQATTNYLKAPSFAKNCATLPQGCATDPLAWGKANPAPTHTGAYPIGGFSFIDMYTCYATANEVNDLVGTTPGSLGFLRWFFGTSGENANQPKKSLNLNGFGAIPGGYISAARKLLTTNAPTKIGTPGQPGTGCAVGVAGPGA